MQSCHEQHHGEQERRRNWTPLRRQLLMQAKARFEAMSADDLPKELRGSRAPTDAETPTRLRHRDAQHRGHSERQTVQMKTAL
jgi:hypothetical protein